MLLPEHHLVFLSFLHSLVLVYTCQNATLLELICTKIIIECTETIINSSSENTQDAMCSEGQKL